jgi:MarR family transcriptional regulator for hemolysin
MVTDFQSSIGYWITLTSHFYQQRLREELIECGITFRQFQVMAWLVHDGQLSQRALVDRLMVEPPTLVGILNRMQREGWIDRRQDANDRRCKWVALRAEAGPVWHEISGCLARIRAQATRNMSADEQKRLMRLLKKVQKNLGVPVDSMSKSVSCVAE